MAKISGVTEPVKAASLLSGEEGLTTIILHAERMSVARAVAAVRNLHRFMVTEGGRPDDPTADFEGVKVPAGIPKPLSESNRLHLFQM